jgi:hypothetical protein
MYTRGWCVFGFVLRLESSRQVSANCRRFSDVRSTVKLLLLLL